MENQGESGHLLEILENLEILRDSRDSSEKTPFVMTPFSGPDLRNTLCVFVCIWYLSGPISRDTAILSLRYPISRDTFFGRLALRQNGAIPPSWYLILHRHIRAIPHFATYRTIIVRFPIKTRTNKFCDTIATSIARYEKYRCWASKYGTSGNNFQRYGK